MRASKEHYIRILYLYKKKALLHYSKRRVERIFGMSKETLKERTKTKVT